MSTHSIRLATALTLLMALVGGVGAQEPLSRAEVAALAKPAIAFVEVKPFGSGSAFCVHSSGLFVTNEHVVKSVAADGTVTLVLDSGLKTQKVLKAKVIRRDKQLDLALLKAQGDHKLAALKLASDEKLSELTELIAFGFPFGTALDKATAFPAVTVNVVNVSSLRSDAKGSLSRIQLDSNLSPGNSGCPVVDRSGKVMGVVVSGIVGAGINNAIPVRHVRTFLDRPVLVFTPPSITAKNRQEPLEFSATAASLLDDGGIELELILKTPDGKERRLPMKAQGNSYRATAAPFPGPSSGSAVRVEIKYADGAITANAKDMPVRIGDESLRLGQMRNLKLGPAAEALLLDGRKIKGTLADFDTVALNLGGQALELKLAGAAELSFSVPADRLVCAVVAHKDGKEIGRDDQTLYAEGTQIASFETLRAGKFIKPLPSSAPASYLKVLSTAGDYIGQGQSYSCAGADLKLSLAGGGVHVDVDGWTLQLAAPRGGVLAAGEYADAKRFPFHNESPGISFYGKGRGANQIAGHFVVWELETQGNAVTKLAVDFLQRAELKGPPLYGMLRYNSSFE